MLVLRARAHPEPEPPDPDDDELVAQAYTPIIFSPSSVTDTL
jgi:hypothetical protein